MQEYKNIFSFADDEIIYLSETALKMIEQRIYSPFTENVQATLSAELVAKLKDFATAKYFGSNTAFNSQSLTLLLIEAGVDATTFV